MPVVKLTARNVVTLPAVDGQRIDYRDEDLTNFVLRVSSSGQRTYAVTYYLGGHLKRVTIGPIERVSLADARDLARKVLADVTKGADPAADRRLAPSARASSRSASADSTCAACCSPRPRARVVRHRSA